MGIGAAAVIVGGAAIGGIAAASRGRQERDRNRAEAERAIANAEDQLDVNRSNWQRAQEDISSAREQVGFQLEQTQDSLDFQLDQARGQFTDRLSDLHRSKRRSVEQIHREGATATAEAAASGVRGGGSVDRVQRDVSDARSDLRHEVSMERRNMDRTMEGVEQEVDTRLEAAQFQADQSMGELDRRHDEARDQFRLNRNQLNRQIESGEEIIDANQSNFWTGLGDFAGGAAQGAMAGAGISQGGADLFGLNTFDTTTGRVADFASGLFGDSGGGGFSNPVSMQGTLNRRRTQGSLRV